MELEKMNMWKYGQTDVFEFIVFKSVKQWYNVLPPQKKKREKRFSYSECSISMVTCDQITMSLGKWYRTFWYR